MKTIDITAAQKYSHFCDLLNATDNPEKATVNLITYDYLTTILKVQSLLETVINLASENLNPDKESLLNQIRIVAEISLCMLPINEMEFLDKILINNPKPEQL